MEKFGVIAALAFALATGMALTTAFAFSLLPLLLT
jgi:xanthine/uracil/vitamin C permease (AzgA family)